MCVCVCVFFPFILDIKFVGRTSRGHTGFFIHLPFAVRDLIFLARRIQPFLSLVYREVEFCKAMLCRVCKFRVGFLMCYRTNRSSGRGIEVAQNLQKLRVGSVTLYPVPVPAPGYFHRPHRSPE